MKYEHNNENKMNGTVRAGVLGCLFMLAAMYFLLLGPDQTVFSVYTICQETKALCGEWQSLAFCLLPFYFSIMIFGGGAMGWFIGSRAHRWVLASDRFAAH